MITAGLVRSGSPSVRKLDVNSIRGCRPSLQVALEAVHAALSAGASCLHTEAMKKGTSYFCT